MYFSKMISMSKEGKNEMAASQNERSQPLYQYGEITLSLDLFWFELALIGMKLSPEMKKSYYLFSCTVQSVCTHHGIFASLLIKKKILVPKGLAWRGKGGGGGCIKFKPPQKCFF